MTSAAPQKIILATFGSHGDVHPFIGLAKTLQARGHYVTLHTSNYFASLAQKADIPFLGFGTPEEFSEALNNPDAWHPTKGVKVVLGELVTKTIRRSYDVLKPVVTKDTLLVGHSLAFSARVLHDELGCPGATVHLAPAVMRSIIAPPLLSGAPPLPNWLPRWVVKKVWQTGDRFVIDPMIAPTINDLRTSIGLPPVKHILKDWWNHPDLIIGLWPEFFAPPIPDWWAQTKLAGFPLYDESDVTPLSEDLQTFLAANPNPIAFTPGSAMLFGQKFFNTAVETCSQLKRPALLLSRHMAHIPRNLPPSVKHVRYAPFSKLLPHCSAIVHHGGIGTTSQALAAGIPQLITPFSHDQPDNALRLKNLGVALSLPANKLTPQKLTPLLNELLTNPAHLKAAKNLAKLVTKDGLTKASEMIESLTPTRLSNSVQTLPQ